MTGSKDKDIVEEVFGRSMNVDDRVSALFTCLERPPQVSLEGMKQSHAAKDAGSSDNKLFQSAKGAKYESLPKRAIRNKKLVHQVGTVVVAGLAVLILALFVSSYLRQHGNDSTRMMQERQYVNRSEIVSPLESQSLLDVQLESVSRKIYKNSAALNWQHVINWRSLLDETTATMPKTVQLSVLERDDGSEMFLEGEALSPDAVYSFVEAFGTNRQVKSAELTENRSEIVGPLENQPVLDVRPESVSGKIPKNSTALDWQHAIDWSSLLGEISATTPKTVQLSVLESGDGLEISLEGEALSTDAVYSFVNGLRANRQVKSAELVKTGIAKGESQDMLTFSIICSLALDRKTPDSIDGDYDNSGFDRSRVFASKEAEKFFGGIQSASEHAGCTVKSLLVSPKDSVFKDEKTNGRIIKKRAVLTLLGGYQNILKALEELQDRSQGVWLDSVSIKQCSGTGRLECSMGISVYVAEGS